MFKKIALASTAVIFAASLSACGSTAPKTWDGTWKADGFTATIQNNVIDVHIQGKDTDALFWNGTFKPASSTVDTETIKSDRNDATTHSMFGSSETVKPFEAKDGNIQFGFTMMGVSRTVTLVKSN